MTSIRLKVTGLAGAIFVAGLGLVLLAGSFLLEPWFAANARGGFEEIRQGMGRGGPGDPGELTRRAQDLAKGTGYKVVVADGAGTVFASSAPEFRPGDSFPLPREEYEYFLDRRDRLERGESFFGILRPEPPGQSSIHLVTGFGPGRFLVVSQSLEQLQKPIAMASGFFVAAGGVILALVFVAFIVLSGSLVRPILGLAGVAQRVAAGDYGARWADGLAGGGAAPRPRTDELGLLGRSIDAMASRLAGDIEELASVNGKLADKVRAQEDFLAGAAHELKTPVGLVRGYAEALKLGYWSTEAERDELADIILKEADHLERLVRDLSFAAMESGAGKSLILAEGDLLEAAREAAARFAHGSSREAVRVKVEGEGVAPARFDRGRLLQALDNLLSNAIRHAEGGDWVTLRVLDTGAAWRLEVENPGQPIPEDHLGRLFEPFHRVDASRNRESGGSGLGLAAVRRIAEAHGGSCGIGNVAGGVLAWIGMPKSQA